MKTNSVLVVEGNSDKSVLSRFFDCEIVVTNGKRVSRETIHYIVELAKSHDIIIITDPDRPGQAIADMLLALDINATQIKLDPNKCKRKNKLGVAEADPLYIKKLITPHLSVAKDNNNKLTLSDLLYFSSINPNYKNYLASKYPVGYGTSKKLLRRLNYLGITKAQIEEQLYG